MRSSTTSGHNTSTAAHSYSPSVPLSIYRELAAELQAAEARLNSLNAQNQQLAKQNQQLRQEIEKAVQAVLHLQQIVDSGGAVKQTTVYHPNSDFRSEPSRPVSAPTGSTHRSPRPPIAVQSVVEEQEEGRYRRRSQPETASEVNGWLLAVAILLIMATAFGAGYLIVRPLLQSH